MRTPTCLGFLLPAGEGQDEGRCCAALPSPRPSATAPGVALPPASMQSSPAGRGRKAICTIWRPDQYVVLGLSGFDGLLCTTLNAGARPWPVHQWPGIGDALHGVLKIVRHPYVESGAGQNNSSVPKTQSPTEPYPPPPGQIVVLCTTREKSLTPQKAVNAFGDPMAPL